MYSTVFIGLLLLTATQGVALRFAKSILPSMFNKSVDHWQIGSVSLACAFAMCVGGGAQTLPVIPALISLLVAAGLTSYLRSLKQFYGDGLTKADFVAVGVCGGCLPLFFIADPYATAPALATLLVWIWILAACVRILTKRRGGEPPAGRHMMVAAFVTVLAAAIAIAVATVVLAFDAGRNPGASVGRDTLAVPALISILPTIGPMALFTMCVGRLKISLERVASTDHLTALSNRRLLDTYGEDIFRRARDRQTSLSVAVLDVDKFKAVNDSFGHAVGDEILVGVARCVKESLRKSDFVARSGGEEFVVIMDDPAPERVRMAAERVRAAIAQHRFTSGPIEMDVTISMGVSTYRASDSSFAEILRRADDALYRAKSLGRNRVEFAPEPFAGG